MTSLLDEPKPKRIPLLPLKVDAEWSCQRSGDCCRLPKAITVSEAEANLLIAWAQKAWPIVRLRTLGFSRDQPGYLRMHAGPCPFLEGQSTCTVYPIRPYSCRRFACFRPDVTREVLVLDTASDISQYRTIGCANLRQRLVESRVARRMYAVIQRQAQRWARRHGWDDGTSEGASA